MADEDKAFNIIGNIFKSSQWVYFIWLTVVFFAGKYMAGGDDIRGTIFTALYFLLLFIMMIKLNTELMKDHCQGTGANSLNTIVFGTLIPWIGILGSTYVLITVFPGWRSPFSNTLGYAAVYLAGAESILGEIIQTKYAQSLSNLDNSKITGDMKMAAGAISSIYENKSLLINEVTPENYTSFWEKMKPLMKPGAYNDKTLFNKFQSIIQLKDIVSECVWFLLSGMLSISVSISYIMNSQCIVSDAIRDKDVLTQ